MKTLKQILGLCEHRLEIKKIVDLYYGGQKGGTKYHLECEKCGNIKSKKV